MKSFLVTYRFRRREHTGRVAAPDAATARVRFAQANPDVTILRVRAA